LPQPAGPDELYGSLFDAVQRARIFPDQKTFPDAVAREAPEEIRRQYLVTKPAGPELKRFVEAHFLLPETRSLVVPGAESLEAHLKILWPLLRRQPDRAVPGSSLLPLPHPYIVPGGRFREIYYWDSYFTMLGLRESGQEESIQAMVDNFASLIARYGHIPNGNRTYYLSRSQPPFFALMVEFLAEKKGESVFRTYRDALNAEYDYWMDRTASTHHVITMADGSTLNRYYDQRDTPRPEAFALDEETTGKAGQDRRRVYRDLRSAAESGWDFSSRWFADGKSLASIETTNLAPVDLNCLLFQLERTLAKAWEISGDANRGAELKAAAERRKQAILHYCWSPEDGFFVDYQIEKRQRSRALTLAGVTPLFLQLATPEQANAVAERIEKRFLQPGGAVTTLVATTGEQWDWPNGWAPLEWMTIRGLKNYGHDALATEIARRWIKLNRDVYARTGRMMEKYNVVDLSLAAGGGEYTAQDGFGWTNGVLLKLLSELPHAKDAKAAKENPE
jgi:alpha,alpha-trehalase